MECEEINYSSRVVKKLWHNQSRSSSMNSKKNFESMSQSDQLSCLTDKSSLWILKGSYSISLLPKVQSRHERISMNSLKSLCHIIDGTFSHVLGGFYNKKEVVIKISQRYPSDIKKAWREFSNEHSILVRLSHDNIVNYYGCGFEDDEDQRQFLVLERLKNGTLHVILTKNASNRDKVPFSYHRVLQLGEQLSSALSYLHEGFHQDVTIIHRDLKPDNIGFTSSGVLKLIDFGLSVCIRRRTSSEITYCLTGNTGSLRYMAPEVMQGLSYNEKVDIYGLGLVLWQIATGLQPYSGNKDFKKEEFYKKIVKHQERPPFDVQPVSRGVNLTTPLTEIIRQCWNADNEKRPSATEIHQMFSTLLTLDGENEVEGVDNLQTQELDLNKCVPGLLFSFSRLFY